MHFGNVEIKMQSYAGTNYLSPRCRPVSSLGYVEAKNKTAASLTGANKQTIKCTFHLTWRSVCACVWKRAESRGPRADWSTLAFYPKWPARSLCWRLIQTTGKILIWAHIPLNRTQASPRPRLDAGSASPVYLRKNINTHDHWCGGYLSDNLNSIPLVYILDRVLLHA